MSELAQLRTDSDGALDPTTYGSNPNNPLTWDGDMIYGCAADNYGYSVGSSRVPPYYGSALQFLSCPNAFNKRAHANAVSASNLSTTSYGPDIQQVTCRASAGSFTLSFRGATTDAILANATALDLQNALQNIKTIGAVTVTLTTGSTTLCALSGTVSATVTFLTELGSLPLLTSDNSLLSGGHAAVFVEHVQKGYGTPAVCGGSGDCDTFTGECKCWDRWTSSDGFGNEGTVGDCAYNGMY